ncbi:MAG: hypothetical protein JST22_20620 [Bacteroidetes bacterium]|nr:hypothetical protein [Bacteroidota bacterium]
MALRPTIFIGIGTTGLEMLRAFRRFVYETYEIPQLPIFKQLVIETREGIIDTDSWFPVLHPSERIEIVPAVIRNLNAVRDRIDRQHQNYDQALADWLPEDLLNIQGNQFVNGASNIRAAGRLCLWMNWREIDQAIESALNTVIAKDNRDATVDLLLKFYEQHNMAPPYPLVDDRPMVYLVGSLCGGTCSGMAVDIANNLRAVQRVPSIYGIFSTVDAQTAIGMNPDNARQTNERANHVANTWAALTELDFVLNSQTKDVPGARVSPVGEIGIDDAPFDYVQLVSPSASGTIRFVDGTGYVDLDQLNNMVALSLFMEAIGEVHDGKEAIRTDYRQIARFNQNNERGHVQQLSSFGLAAVLYPRTRIAAAAACLQTAKLCERWIGDAARANRNAISAYAEEDWNANIARIEGKLIVDSHRGRSIRDEIRNAIQDQRNQLLALPFAELWSAMQTFPTISRPLVRRLELNGEYSTVIANNLATPFTADLMEVFLGELAGTILGAVDQRLTNGDLTSVTDAQIYIEQLKNHIRGRIAACPVDPPPVNIQLLRSIQNLGGDSNVWAAVIGLKDRATEQKKAAAIARFECYLLDRLESLKLFYMRGPLKELIQALDRRKRELDEVLKVVQEVRNDALELADELRTVPNWMNVGFVFRTGSIDKDIAAAENMVTGRMPEVMARIVPSNIGLLRFLRDDSSAVFAGMKSAFQALILNELRTDDATKLTVDLGNEALGSLFSRAVPYEDLDLRRIQEVRGTRMVEMTIGGGNEALLERLVRRMSELRLIRGDARVVHSPLADHLVVVYREQGALAIDDLAMANKAAAILASRPGQFGHATHRKEDFYDVERGMAEKERQHDRVRRIDCLSEWLLAAEVLCPEIFMLTGDRRNPRRVIVIKGKGGIDRSYPVDQPADRAEIVNEDSDSKVIDRIVGTLFGIRENADRAQPEPLQAIANAEINRRRNKGENVAALEKILEKKLQILDAMFDAPGDANETAPS